MTVDLSIGYSSGSAAIVGPTGAGTTLINLLMRVLSYFLARGDTMGTTAIASRASFTPAAWHGVQEWPSAEPFMTLLF